MSALLPVLVSLLAVEEEAHRGIAPQVHVMVTPTVPGAPPIIIPGNHPPVWSPNTELGCKKEGPPGGWGTGGPSQGEKNSHLFPQECLDMNPNPPAYCRGWGSGGCQPNDCHMTVVEDSGDLAPHGQRWACEVSDCNADGMTDLATQTLDWHFDLARVEHPHYDTCHRGRENPTCPNEQDTFDYTDPCDRLYFDTANPPADCTCPMMGRTDDIETSTWNTNEFWDDDPDAFFREGDKCDPPLDGPPVCPFGGNPGIGGTGTIQFTTAPDRWGTFYYNVWMSDDGITFPVCNGMCGVPIPCAGGCNGAVDINGIPAACNVNPPGQTCKVCKLTILPVNDCPVWDSIGDIEVLEDRTDPNCAAGNGPAPPIGDAGVARPYGVCINNWATNIGAGGWFEWPYQNVWFDCSTDNTLLFKPGFLPRVDGVPKLTNDNCVRNCRGDHCSSRNLVFTLADDQCGHATVSCTLHDDGGENDDGCDKSPVVTFKIDIKCVNDAPTFTPSRTEITIDEDACEMSNTNDEHCSNGVYCQSNWATDISAGPPNEQSGGGCGPSGGSCMFQPQTIHFEVTSADPTFGTLFSSTPTVDEQGRLCIPLAQHHNTGNGFIDLTVRLFDTGGTADGGVDRSTPVNLRLRVTPINDVPTFTMSDSVLVLEDSGVSNTQQITNICLGGLFGPTCADFNERPEPQSERFEIQNVYDETLFAVQPSFTPTGQLQFTPAADRSGTVELEVSLCDNAVAPVSEECSPVRGVIITIKPVNDPPVLTHVGNVAVAEDSPLYSNPNWGTVLSVGVPVDEQQSQELVLVSVVAADPSLFEIQPTLSRDGTLSFKPAADRSGTTDVTVTIRDNGGTQDGGQDTTVEVFSISVGAVNDPPILSIASGNSVVTDEDSGLSSIPNFASLLPGPPHEVVAGQTIATTSCSNTNINLFETTSQPELSLTGDLTYTPLPNAFGEATVTCTATDSVGSSSTLQFNIIVQPINDPPTFNVIASSPTMRIQIPRCSSTEQVRCSRTTTGAVSNVEPGPPNESDQTVRFEGRSLSTDTNIENTFLQYNQVGRNGDLHLTLSSNSMSGNVDVDVVLTALDNGSPPGVTTETIYVTLTDSPDPPSMLQPEDVSSSEDRNINIASFGREISSNTASATCTAVDTLLVPNLVLNIENGLLSGSTGTNLFGTTSATCTLTSTGGLQRAYQFQLTITPVNDAPYFSVSESVIFVTDSSTPQSVMFIDVQNPSGMLGGNTENDQTLTYYFSGQNNNNNNLFASGPTLVGDRLQFTGLADVVGTAIIQITIRDDGGTLDGGQDVGNTQEVAIVFGQTNEPPSFTINGALAYTVLEDSGTTTIRQWGIQISDGDNTDGSVTQQLAFVIQTLPSVLFDDITVHHVTGDLVFTPKLNAFGSEVFTIVLSEVNTPLESNPVLLTINITPVNDPPVFNTATSSIIGDSQLQVGDSSTYVYPRWARDLAAGPLNENTQTTQFDITVPPTNGLLESVNIAIPDGDITFVTNSEGRTGVASVQVCLKDNGGVENNGDDTTCSQVGITVINSIQNGFLRTNDVTVMQTAGVVLVRGFVTNSMITILLVEITTVFLHQNTEFSQDPQIASSISDEMLFLTPPSINNNVDLSFTTNRTTDGRANIRVTARNAQGNTVTENFVITINMVPSLPTFTPGNSPILISEAVSLSESGSLWSSNISHGLPPPYISPIRFIVTPTPSLVTVSNRGVLELNTQLYSNINSLGNLNDPTYELLYTVTLLRERDNVRSSMESLRLVNTNAGGVMPTFDVVSGDVIITEDVVFERSGFIFNVVGGIPSCSEVSSSSSQSKIDSITLTQDNTNTNNYNIRIATNTNMFGETSLRCEMQGIQSIIKTIMITPVNDIPIIVEGGNSVDLLEDSVSVTFPNWIRVSPGPFEVDSLTASVSAVAINSLDANSVLLVQSTSQPNSDSKTFDLSFTLMNNLNGINQLSYQITDSGSPPLSLLGNLVITVTAVNDPPVFLISENMRIIDAVAGSNIVQQIIQTQTISAGGGVDENQQTLSFEGFYDNGNPISNLISNFELSPTGLLTCTAPSTPGMYSISVLLRDSGGTQNGGLDRSASQQFTLNVSPSSSSAAFTLSSQTVDIFTRQFNVQNVVTNIQGTDLANTRLTVVPRPGFNAFSSGPEITSTDNLQYSVSGLLLNSWVSQNQIELLITISDSLGVGQSSVLTLVPYFNNQPFEVFLPPGVTFNEFLVAYASDVGTSDSIRIIAEEQQVNGWNKVTFEITGQDRSKQEQTVMREINNPNSSIRRLGITDVRPVPTQSSSPSPTVSDTVSPVVVSSSDGGIPSWVIPVAVVAAVLLLIAAAAAAYSKFNSSNKKSTTEPTQDDTEHQSSIESFQNIPLQQRQGNPITTEFGNPYNYSNPT